MTCTNSSIEPRHLAPTPGESGTYWSSTMRDHVVYESRLELTRLLFADFDLDMTAVFTQPFRFSTTVNGQLRRHVPDFLLFGRRTCRGPSM